MIARTEAVVLRSMKYRETSRIVTYYTREFGKLAGIVKGARQPKQKFGAALQPMSYVTVVLYKKDGRDLQTVSECDLVKSFRSLMEDLDKMAVGMSIIESVSNIAHEEEGNTHLFDLLVESLTVLDETNGNPANIFLQFEIRLAGILGFRPVFDHCIGCGKTVGPAVLEVLFDLDKGGPVCAGCRTSLHGHSIRISGGSVRMLAVIEKANPRGELASLEFDRSARHEMEQLLQGFLRRHVSGVRALKSERVFSKIQIDA